MAKTRGGLGVIYEVRQDPHDLGKWIVQRGGAGTGSFTRDKSTAVGLAIYAANREAKEMDVKVKVVSVVSSKRTTEWPSP